MVLHILRVVLPLIYCLYSLVNERLLLIAPLQLLISPSMTCRLKHLPVWILFLSAVVFLREYSVFSLWVTLILHCRGNWGPPHHHHHLIFTEVSRSCIMNILHVGLFLPLNRHGQQCRIKYAISHRQCRAREQMHVSFGRFIQITLWLFNTAHYCLCGHASCNDRRYSAPKAPFVGRNCSTR